MTRAVQVLAILFVLIGRRYLVWQYPSPSTAWRASPPPIVWQTPHKLGVVVRVAGCA